MAAEVKVYVETGSKRAFAGAIDWPGWSRGGKDEASALQALFEYRQRYADVLRRLRVPFTAPARLADLRVIERLKGGTTTDFGAPQAIPAADTRAMDEAELKHNGLLLKACWATLDAVAKTARGKTLRTGPRGGGRTLEQMVAHVREAEAAYIASLGWKDASGTAGSGPKDLSQMRVAALHGLRAAAAGEIPAVGPRGGKRWPPRYFVRRAAWHILDHAWEIEDRLE